MKSLRRSLATAVLIAAAASLAACAAAPYRLPGPRAAELTPDQGLIVFRADDVGPVPAKRIQYTDNAQRVDYALYRGGGAQAEFVYMDKPYGLTVSFVYEYNIQDKVRAWNFAKGEALDWGEAVIVRARVGPIFVRPYRMTAQDRRCFGVNGEWDVAPDDPRLLYTRIMFGYYCAPPGQALPAGRIQALVDGIGLRGITERTLNFADPVHNFHADVEAHRTDPVTTQRAIELAQGRGLPAKAGIDEFPFDYIEYYSIGGNDVLFN